MPVFDAPPQFRTDDYPAGLDRESAKNFFLQLNKMVTSLSGLFANGLSLSGNLNVATKVVVFTVGSTVLPIVAKIPGKAGTPKSVVISDIHDTGATPPVHSATVPDTTRLAGGFRLNNISGLISGRTYNLTFTAYY